MSGSPVVVSHSGVWNPHGKLQDDSVIGTVENLLGVYAGRMNLRGYNEPTSDIGIVWKMPAVQQIVDDGVHGATLTDWVGSTDWPHSVDGVHIDRDARFAKLS